jgi:hypothetical protein
VCKQDGGDSSPEAEHVTHNVCGHHSKKIIDCQIFGWTAGMLDIRGKL